jgi:1-acyl-sn-glycerol-3-phosphate acyltransferase
MKEALRTAVSGTAAVGITGVLSPLVSLLTFVDEEAPDPVIFLWARSVLKATGVHSRCEGLENLPEGNFVLCVNHQSHFDALVLFTHIHRHMRFVAKQELKKIPIFGPALKRAGNVFVDRSSSGKDRSTLDHAVDAVRHRTSIVFFAEGTRSDDGVLRPFKKGAAVFAIEAQVPLVPAAVAGTHEILPKGKLAIRPRPAALVVGKPIDTTGLTIEARDELTVAAHAAVAECLRRAETLLPTAEGGP